MKKIIITILISIITISILLSFIDRTPNEQVGNTADIVYSINNIPTNLKSVGDLNKREQDIICATSRGLVEVDSEGNINPVLAECYEINEDGLEYIFKIRNDVYWSNGDKIMPGDIVSFFRQVITEENEISALLNVFGVYDYLNTDKSFSETVAITCDENSVKIRLNSKDNNFIEELTKPQYRLRKDILFWEDINSNYNNISYSGNYYIDNIGENEIVLKRSEKSDNELAETIHLTRDDNEDLALAAFEIGNRDIVINPPKSQLQRLKDEHKLIESPSNESLYLAFNINNSNFSNSIKNEIYRLVNEAVEEYQSQNSISIELAECSYFREDKDDLTKLQTRNVIMNVQTNINMPEKVVLVANESLENKDITNYIYNWFKKNTDITIVVNLLSEQEMDLISEKNYYDIALVNVYARLDDEEEFLNKILSFLPKQTREMMSNSKSKSEKEELFAEIEEDIFNNYRILPLLFYNDTIAINSNIENTILDANGNIDFTRIKK